MNAKNRKLLITGGSFGLLLGLTFGGLTFADGPVLFHTGSYQNTATQDLSRQNELAIAAIVIVGSAVAVTCGVALPTRRSQ